MLKNICLIHSLHPQNRSKYLKGDKESVKEKYRKNEPSLNITHFTYLCIQLSVFKNTKNK